MKLRHWSSPSILTITRCPPLPEVSARHRWLLGHALTLLGGKEGPGFLLRLVITRWQMLVLCPAQLQNTIYQNICNAKIALREGPQN